ncbi:ataxin-1a [Hippocampus comes]|uniref:Ataxin 1a n=1 Tax=Hippocampus comes TaxID=109280 RepID=A0A3Q3DLX4_HIPCM|nr:PREDICTED: ataxin-1-like [Hippocampus comes]XP_019745833.1 PREDICTED: ataxin-1-like [Hippocampus comes]XP_019745834.1 PREDICTED: ataxin-1-like [Hippocampus comes]XP_019745835.1 PREDICTED: ataxin-1-like [Hippocampus comes]XP_019745836.1 PREDICTED: ataxin-1-like [Hippocampus comes]
MKSNHERSNECLPPKKREIPPSTVPSESHCPIAPPPTVEPQPPGNLAWFVAGGSGSATSVPRSAAQSDAALYKSSASDSMRLVSSLPAVYTSPQTHVGGTLHYAQLPPNVQFITSPYSAPYAGYIAPQLLPPPPPPPSLSSSTSQRLSSLPEKHATKYDQPRASIRYASAMPPPHTSSLQPHHTQGAHYTDVSSARKEDGGAGSKELHNGGLEPSRKFGVTPEKAVKLRDAYEACQLVLPSDYAHDPLALRTSVMLMPNSHGDPQVAPSRGSPRKTHLEKGSILLGKPVNRTPLSSNHSFTFPSPLGVDNLKASFSTLSPQTVIQTTHNSTVEPLSVGVHPSNIYPQTPVIGYIAEASGSQHAPISYHTSLQQHVLIAGAQPVIIPVSGSGASTLEPPASQVVTSSPQAYGGETPDNPGSSCHQVTSGTVVQAQLHLPVVPSMAPAPLSGGAAAAPPSLPAYFFKGSIIQLADGELKRVEELKMEDFIQSAEISSELKIDSSTVERIDRSCSSPNFAIVQFSVGEHRSQVSVEVLVEYPFFVFGQGWSSCCPDRTARLLELPCTKLSVGDVCISLTLKNLRNGSLTKTHLPEPVPASLALAPSHGYLLDASKTVSGVPQSSAGRGSRHGEQENGVVAVENGDLGFSERASFLKEDPRKPTSSNSRKRRWSAPECRKVEKPEELPLTLVKPTFIPHEVKVTIEGRSNIGK